MGLGLAFTVAHETGHRYVDVALLSCVLSVVGFYCVVFRQGE